MSVEPYIAKKRYLNKVKKHTENTPIMRGYDWNQRIDYSKLFESYVNTGFQATNPWLELREINLMLDCRQQPLKPEEADLHETDEFITRKHSCTIFLRFTSNLVSSGLRETLRFPVEHHMVDCVVMTAGGVEEVFIKCLAPTYMASFEISGRDLRDRGINRIDNLLVPNDNNCKFEDWLMPLLEEMVEDQKTKGMI